MPKERAKRADISESDRESRVDRHGILPFKFAKPESVATVVAVARGVIDDLVVVEVELRVDAGVRRSGVTKGIAQRVAPILTNIEKIVMESVEREPGGIVVELIDEDNVRANDLEHLCNAPGIGVVLVVELIAAPCLIAARCL